MSVLQCLSVLASTQGKISEALVGFATSRAILGSLWEPLCAATGTALFIFFHHHSRLSQDSRSTLNLKKAGCFESILCGTDGSIEK